MPKENIVIPTIHLNGTSRAEIMSALSGANEALFIAIEAVGRTAPNGRDYYGSGDIKAATDQHNRRIWLIEEVRRELEDIAIAVASQE
jgi:hypothetical protein